MCADAMWSFLDDEEAKSGGGAIVGLIEFSIGYKLFVSGRTQVETWFELTPGDEESKKKAESAAKKFAEANGLDVKNEGRPQMCVQFRVFKNEVLGREVTWKDDRFFTHPLWTPGYKEVVKPALKAAGVTAPGKYWGRIGFTKDPTGREEMGPDGKMRVKTIEHLIEVYKDKAAAMAAAGMVGGQPATTKADQPASIPGVPAGWEQATWEAIKPEIKADYLKRLNGDTGAAAQAKAKAALATDYGVTVADISTAIA